MLSGNQSESWWCQGPFNSFSEFVLLLGERFLTLWEIWAQLPAWRHASFQRGACTLVSGWSEIFSKNTFKIDLQLLWWQNRTRISGNWMVYFPSSSHTGQDMRIWCVMKLLLPNELLHILWHGARDYVLGFACSKWSLALFLHIKCNSLQSRCLYVCTVIIWQWIVLNCCKGNSACVLS